MPRVVKERAGARAGAVQRPACSACGKARQHAVAIRQMCMQQSNMPTVMKQQGHLKTYTMLVVAQ